LGGLGEGEGGEVPDEEGTGADGNGGGGCCCRARRRSGARRVLPAPVWPRMRTATGRRVGGFWPGAGRKGCSSAGRILVWRMASCSAGEICQDARSAAVSSGVYRGGLPGGGLAFRGDIGLPGRVDDGHMGAAVSLEAMVAFPLTVQTGHAENGLLRSVAVRLAAGVL
jgi:hypothetical protein